MQPILFAQHQIAQIWAASRRGHRTTRDPDGNIEQVVDLGFVGEPAMVDTSVIDTAVAAGMIPVIAPIAPGEDGATYNINADTMAGAIAAALGAARLFLLTDVAGVLDGEGRLLTDLVPADIAKLREDGVIRGGAGARAGDLRQCGRGRVRSCGGARWAGVLRDAARILHRSRSGRTGARILKNTAIQAETREHRCGARRIKKLIRLHKGLQRARGAARRKGNGPQCKDWLYSSISW